MIYLWHLRIPLTTLEILCEKDYTGGIPEWGVSLADKRVDLGRHALTLCRSYYEPEAPQSHEPVPGSP